ncbi:DUF7546 family protein [Haloarchaeobius iranensis]|uniref:Uncharacterized protein n=1 Tax=Haloarchaeobius iranensis TaxID=996166 RepID=A0A1G9W3J4_9EURY|nr:hypothetical protein [Haloarchaeobius iranensis]SDM78863.1 hypothetical protein SAMN05192554_107127 [Haloarchaeobius iranensis]
MAPNTATVESDTLPSERTLWLLLLVAVELLALAAYFVATGERVLDLRYVVYPFVWVNVAAYAVVHTAPVPGSRRTKAAAAAVAVGYLALLAWLVGIVGLHDVGTAATGLSVRLASPGWGPIVAYVAPFGHVTLVPFRVFGYLALSYLVYATVAEAASSSVGGLVGLFSCVSCALPVVSSVGASLTGSTTAALGTVYAFSLDASTLVFVVAVALLYWRPGVSLRASA